MEILSIFSKEFAAYGKVLDGFDTTELVNTLKTSTPIGSGVEYVMSEPALEILPIARQFSENAFGGEDIQIGWCNGHNTKLNCLEYHKSSEINIGAEDFILLLATMTDIENGRLDTARVKAFKAPANTAVELYSTTLHYAPCSAAREQGFKVAVVLPMGTNGKLNADFSAVNQEDKTLWAVNKWLLAHPESAESRQGAAVLLDGENIDIAEDI